MEKHCVNPWDWQDQFGFSQAWRVDDPGSVIKVSGQTAVGLDGQVEHENDFAGQVRTVFRNLTTVLEQAGGTREDVVKLGAYVTEEDHVREYSRIQQEFFPDESPSQSLLVVKALALPDLMVEVEATAFLG